MRAPTVFLVLLIAVAGCGPPAGSPETPAAADAGPPAPPSTAPSALADWLPASLDGRDRQSLDQTVDAALGAEVTRVSAGYGDPPAVTLSVTDFGTADMTTMMGHGWALAPGAERLDGRPVQRDASTVRVLADGRYLVEAEAPTVAEAEGALRSVRLPE